MRTMISESSAVQEQLIHKDLLSARVKVTNTVQTFCKYLIDSALNHGRYHYPSLNIFKFDEKLSLFSRTIDRLVRFLVQVNILAKFPRSKTQAYQVNVNNPLFHLILRIYHPVHPITICSKQDTWSMKRIKELQSSKEHLKYVFSQLESEEDYRLELQGNLLDEIIESITVLNVSTEDLKEKLRSIILEFSTGAEINKFCILDDLLQKENKGD